MISLFFISIFFFQLLLKTQSSGLHHRLWTCKKISGPDYKPAYSIQVKFDMGVNA